LDLTNSFIWDFKESDYECVLDFWFPNTEANKCNPSTVIVPLWTYDFNIKIISKYSSIFSEKSFKVVNNGYLKPINITKVLSSISSSSSAKKKNTWVPPIKIAKPVIIVQGWLNTNNECSNKKNCSINFKYAEKSKFENCEWDFWWWIFKPWINTKCDPWYVDYWIWKFSLKLRVYEAGNYNNFASSEFIFSNIVPVSEIQTNILQKSDNINILWKNSSLGIKIYKVMPNPSWSDDLEYIELINNSDEIFNLKWCKLDDILDWWSKEFVFEEDEFLWIWKTKKYQKELTGLNLNNDSDEVNLICDEKILDIFKWNFEIKSWYELDHAKLDTSWWKAKVIDVIDWDTIKIQFLDSTKIENFRLIWVDTPETKHPNKEVWEYWIEAYNYVLKQLKWKEVLIELDSNNLRDTYSRLLWFVYLWDISFNKKLIELWYSKAYLTYDFKYKSDYVKAEKIAKKAELWIWANENVVDILSKEEIIDSENEEDLDEIKDLNSKIILQWKVWKNKILKWNTLTCYDTCSINFDWSESTWNIKQFSWDFWNWQKFEWKNPWYVKYKTFWKYKIYLAVASNIWEIDIWEFNINFIKTPKKQKVAKKSSTKTKSDSINEYEDEEIYYEDWTKSEDFNYSILLYICIWIFWVVLLSIILKKEKLI
jgi:micrococcal nuclease